jgi:hypothetical protein
MQLGQSIPDQSYSKTHSDYTFDNIFSLIFYYLNYFTMKKLQNENDYKQTEYVIYSENDITDDLKEKIILNNTYDGR